MESKWLEDFISLVETRSFSKSAVLRNVTQPAFSRRIQSLEAWVGVDLIDRTVYPTRLTPAGEVFYEQALEMLAQVGKVRALLRGQRLAAAGVVDIAVPHTLSLTFVPRWITGLERSFGRLDCRLLAGNVHDAVLALVEGGCDLLICYHHPRQPVQLDPARYDMLVLGTERLSPFARAGRDGEPVHRLPGEPGARVPFLAYSSNAYLGRMFELLLATHGQPLHLDRRYETDMAEGLKMMALEGHGVAFLPESAVLRELRSRQLARAGDPALMVEMDIRLYRERPTAARPGKAVADRLWQHLTELPGAGAPRPSRPSRP
ncbi:MAG TPA: LysR substrate-binding domain-containing protein [Burkholderiaceae bacterium]|nr:LysR substrate-binding domain-containing protein [Burkholderiaceae bacterium]